MTCQDTWRRHLAELPEVLRREPTLGRVDRRPHLLATDPADVEAILGRASAAPDSSHSKFRVRSLVGLIPLFAVERLELAWIEPFAAFKANLAWFLENRQELVAEVVHPYETRSGTRDYLLTNFDQQELGRKPRSSD